VTQQYQYQIDGWAEINGEGVASLYFSITDEGITTSPSDTPANATFRPRVLNPESFSIKRQPVMWVHGSTSGQQAAFGSLEIDNYDGAFNVLLQADLRDTLVEIWIVPAMALTTGTQFSDKATLICTGIIDTIGSSNEDVITITIKDTLARLDKTLPVKVNPPFADQGAANVMVPISLGACRNVQPLLVDTPNRIFQLHDAPIPNVASVFDMAAQLDPNANPPQYTAALNGSALQLQTMPQGLLTSDLSSYGAQSVFPGNNDILSGAGQFTGTWTGTPLVPPGFTWTAGSGSAITERFAASYPVFGTSNGALLKSSKAFWPFSSIFGETFAYPSLLQPGYTYRATFGLYNVHAAASPVAGGDKGGFMLAIAASSTSPADYISGYGVFLGSPQFGVQMYAYEFTIPPGSAPRPLCFLACATQGSTAGSAVGTCTGTVFNLEVEQVGQFTALPLTGIPYDAYCTEVLVNRAGESPAIFNAAEAAALFLRTTANGYTGSAADGSLIPFGVHYDSPPNILDMLQRPLDSQGAVKFTDSTGALRFRQFLDPSDPSIRPKASFTPANTVRPISNVEDQAAYLTTLFGARPNWKVFTAADFVTDQALVPQDEKTRYMRPSQFWVNASVVPAGQYNFSISAPIFDSVLDLATDAQVLADRIVGIWSPKIYANGTSTNGKRRIIEFTALYNDPSHVGIDAYAAVTDLQYGDIVGFTWYSPGNPVTPVYNNQPVEIIGWEIFPFANKIHLITVL
jgi:hypothetical protein